VDGVVERLLEMELVEVEEKVEWREDNDPEWECPGDLEGM
jgi:hypothetical protein